MDDWTPALNNSYDSDAPVRQEFDPSWPYNFKWGYDAQNEQTRVWRVNGGVDGRPYHRPEFTRAFGREPQVRQGDVLGLATYIPAEKKLGGEIVAPPTILLQAYYGMDIPQGVFDFFDEAFPGVVARRAKIATSGDTWDDWAPDIGSGEEEITKWVWNQSHGVLIWQTDENGLPTHEMKIEAEWHRARNPKDYLGYAVPNGAQIELETYRPGTPPVAVQTVKQQLSELHPDKEIVLPQEFAPDYGVDFNSDPGTYARREAVVAWANSHLATPSEHPLGGSVSPSEALVDVTGSPESSSRLGGLQRLLRRRPFLAASGADKDGAMVAIFIPEEVGEKLFQKGGEPVEDMHVTLAYFAEKAADRDDWEEVKRIVEQIANQHPPLSGKVGGIGVFTNDSDVLWASPNIPGLAELRDDIVEAVEEAGFPVSKDHGWSPHITLKYDFSGKLPKLPKDLKLEIDSLTFAQGDDQKHFKFEGGFEKEAGLNGDLPEGLDVQIVPFPSLPGYIVKAMIGPTQIGELVIHEFSNGSKRISDVSVNPKYRRTGVASAMLEKARSELGGVSHSRHLTDDGAAWAEKTAADDWAPDNSEQWWGTDPNTGTGGERGPQSWSGWKGAYRFVSDGKTTMLEPEEDLGGWHGGGHMSMQDEFRRRNPGEKKLTLSTGWAVPTADDMGYGISSRIGWGDEQEPEIHDVIASLEKELGKPCHLVNGSADLVDPERYSQYPEGGHYVGLR